MTIEARFRINLDDFELDIDLSTPANGVTALFGPSGSGKTTLLRAIAGLDYHPGGFLRVGEAVWQDNDRMIPTHDRQLGYVFQEPSLFPHLTVKRNLEYGNKRVPEGERKVVLEQAIALLGIGDILERKPERLSGGERQRVAIARAIAVSPRLLLMDEPLASLDQERKEEILPYLESLRAELDIPVIYVSHSLDEVARIANHFVLLEGGSIKADGPIGDMLARLDLSIAKSRDAGALVEAVVSGHDEVYHLTHLDFDGGRFIVEKKDLPIGMAVRMRVAARDVSITLEPQTKTSILNIFRASIEGIIPDGESRVTVALSLGGTPILARLTRKSAETLNLKPGKQVYAQVKSVALLN
jgi:molybdate transport system ATP-binding protein